MAPSFCSYSEIPQSVSFSGSGFLATYQLGVAQCFLTYAPWILRSAPCVLGASAGSLVAAAVVCEMNLIAIRDEMIHFAKQLQNFRFGPLNPSVNVFHWLEKVILKYMPSDAHHMSTGRLAIAVTRLTDGKQIVISEYHSKEEVVQALLCSCFVPGYCGFQPPSFQGVHYMDGGFSGIQPIMPHSTNRTLTVCPFSGEIDICPPDPPCLLDLLATGVTLKGNMANSFRIFNALYPMGLETLEQAFHNGHKDAIHFLHCHDLAPFMITQMIFKGQQKDNQTTTQMCLKSKEEEKEKVDNDLTTMTSLSLSGSAELSQTTEPDVSECPPVEKPLLSHTDAVLGNMVSFLGMFGVPEKILSYLLLPFLVFNAMLQNSHRLEFLFNFDFIFFTWHNLRHCAFFFVNTVFQTMSKNIHNRIMLIVPLLQWIKVQTRNDIPRRHKHSSPHTQTPSQSEEFQRSK